MDTSWQPPDHSKDPHPYYRGITDPAAVAAWATRYERRMTGYCVPVPERKPEQGRLFDA